MVRLRFPAFAAASLLALTAVSATAAEPPAPVDLSPVPELRARSPLPAHWHHGPFMEIFVRGYQDSDGDGIGDLRGLISRLDYLQSLGIKGLWLMPITASADRDHGYATTDYRAIAPEYGTLADFDELIRQAHRRGIGVVMDYVINHSASAHPLFQAAQAPDSRWRDWFVWSTAPQAEHQQWDIWGKTPWYLPGEPLPGGQPATAPDGTPRYFAVFGPEMPDFNMRHPDVVRYHADSLRFWLNRGLDGFRLDAVPHLIENSAQDWNDQPESRRLTAWFTQQIKRYPQRFVVCEATAEPKVYTQPEICGSAFAFGLERAVIEAAQGDAAQSAAAVQKVAAFFTTAPTSMATMLSNHDIFAGRRPFDQFAGDETRYRLAAATYLLLPGTPFLYYGEEIGQAGVTGLPGDEPLRAPMSWTADGRGFSAGTPFRPVAPNAATHNVQAQLKDPGSLLSFYKAVLTLRNAQPALARGRYEAPVAQGQVLAFQRVLGQERLLVAINYGGEAVTLDRPALQLPPRARLQTLYRSGAEAVRTGTEAVRGGAPVQLPPRSIQVLRVR